jgi:uncharacterized protein (DUF427 family)
MERITPGPGQESVWDYPRPPRVEPVAESVRVEFAGRVIARSDRAMRVLETSHPPVYYLPLDDIEPGLVDLSPTRTFCEFKGIANYYSLEVDGRRSPDAAWTFLDPTAGYEPLRGLVAFYPGRVDACFVGEERVFAQEGDFYGGWITSKLVGPFKGGPGTRGW